MLDFAGILLAFYLASNIRLGIKPDFLTLEFIGLSLVIITSLFLGNAYTSATLDSRPRLPLSTFFVVLASALPAMLFIYLLGPERFTYLFGRGIFPAAILATGAFAMANRLGLNVLFSNEGKIQSVLLIGDLKSQEHFDSAINQGLLSIKLMRCDRLKQDDQVGNFKAIVIAPDHRPDTLEQQALITARLNGVPIFSLSDFFESFLFLVPVNEINNDWFIRTEGFTMLHSAVNTRVKRALDVILAGCLLIISIPICLVVAVLIKLFSRGPIFFNQERVGFKGQRFTLHKFRTMAVDAEKNGAQWAKNNDERVYPLGKLLRATRIDELPQCWNILKGEMSLIGPRPERPEFTTELAKEIPYYELRHIVKPGLTGWAQVSYPYGASFDDALRKLQYDLYYIKNYSLLLDLNILLRTSLVMVGRQGR